MTSPGSKQEQEIRLQRKLNAWATSELDPRASFRNVNAISKAISLRGRERLIRKFGIHFVERIEQKAQAHLFNRWITLRKGLDLAPPSKEDIAKIPKEIREQASIKFEKPKSVGVLFQRGNIQAIRIRERNYTQYRNVKTGRFTTPPHRKRSR